MGKGAGKPVLAHYNTARGGDTGFLPLRQKERVWPGQTLKGLAGYSDTTCSRQTLKNRHLGQETGHPNRGTANRWGANLMEEKKKTDPWGGKRWVTGIQRMRGMAFVVSSL